MKWLILLLVVLISSIINFSYAQKTEFNDAPAEKSVTSEPGENNTVIYYVKSGDTWYGIARKFGITYAQLRLANKGTDDKLIPGREIIIPSEKLDPNDSYFKKKPITPVPPVTSPETKNLYHTVEKTQTLFSISKIYKISVDEIKSLNNLKSNSISIGQKLIVGKEEKPSLNNLETQPEIKSVDKEAVKSLENDRKTGVEIVKSVPVEKVETIHAIEDKPENKPLEVRNEELNDAEPLIDSRREKIVFANGREEINEMGIARLIENEDHSVTDKYYGLHLTAPMGTIIRVLNMSNSRKIYVKITGQLSEEDEKNGVVIKISKSCAETLGATSNSIKVNLLYGMNKE